ncbi:MAG: hypothetical protein WBW71_12520 [Bacteroidota bacterium]
MKTRTFLFVVCLSFFAIDNSQAQNSWRPFSNDSPWNTKIPPHAAIDSQSSRFIDSLSKGSFFVNIDDWSVPVYYIDSDTVPKVNVINSRPGIYGKGFVEPNHIPILPNFVASPPVGDFSDNHLCVLDTSKMIEWDMWAARKNKEGVWTTGLGAVTDLRSSGVEIPWFDQVNQFDSHRSRAGGFPLIAGLIRPEEIKNGTIDHALVFAYQRGRSEFFIPPASTAQATMMEMNNRVGIPMGGRIQLDPSIDVDTLNLTHACKIIAKALQEYGAYNGDYAGATVLYADNSPSALKQWKGVLQKFDLLATFTPAFVRKYFRAIAMGNLLPGQNLKDGQIGFVDFTFPGVLNVSIDWLDTSIVCVADSSVDLADITPVFKTAGKNSSVYIEGVKQESGKSLVRFNSDAIYRIDVPGVGDKYWTVKVRKI